jgi:hypothetical protein
MRYRHSRPPTGRNAKNSTNRLPQQMVVATFIKKLHKPAGGRILLSGRAKLLYGLEVDDYQR